MALGVRRVGLDAEGRGLTGPVVRVLVAKPGLDGHDRGARIIAAALRDAGMEVVYTGIRQTPEMIVAAALQEDVDCIGLSILSGAPVEYSAEIVRLLAEQGAGDVKLFVGGIVSPDDRAELDEIGVAGVFGPGSSTAEIVDAVRAAAAA